VEGELSLSQGGLPTHVRWSYTDDNFPRYEEYRILETVQVEGLWMPARACVVWYNGPAAESMLYVFTFTNWQHVPDLTRDGLRVSVPAGEVEIHDQRATH
jgi:hypothetical protein